MSWPALRGGCPGTLLRASSSTRAIAGGSARDRRSPFPASSLDTQAAAAAAARLRGGTRFPPASGSQPPRHAVHALAQLGLGGLHGEGLAHPAPRAEKDSSGGRPSAAGRPAARRRVRCRSWIGRTPLLCAARGGRSPAIIHRCGDIASPTWVSGETLALQPRQRHVQRQHVDHRRPPPAAARCGFPPGLPPAAAAARVPWPPAAPG